MRIPRIVVMVALALGLVVTTASTAIAGGGPTAFTLDPTSATFGVPVTLTATVSGGDTGTCSLDLRLQLLDLNEDVVSDNGNGGIPDATQILLDLFGPGSNYGPGQYLIRVLCGAATVGEDLPFEIVAAAAPADTVEAAPVLTG
jgi:hypothetical protein